MKYLDHDIIEKELTKPLDQFKYFAKMNFLYVIENGVKKNIGHLLGETYGKDKSEAYSKMEQIFHVWKKKNIK
jgi:hypothetical protein